MAGSGGGGLQGAGGTTFTGLNIDAQPFAGAHRFINGGYGGMSEQQFPAGGLGGTANAGGYPSEQTFQPSFDPDAGGYNNIQPQGTPSMVTWAIPSQYVGGDENNHTSYTYTTLPEGINPPSSGPNHRYNEVSVGSMGNIVNNPMLPVNLNTLNTGPSANYAWNQYNQQNSPVYTAMQLQGLL